MSRREGRGLGHGHRPAFRVGLRWLDTGPCPAAPCPPLPPLPWGHGPRRPPVHSWATATRGDQAWEGPGGTCGLGWEGPRGPPPPTRTRVTQTRWTSAEGWGGGLPGAECLCSSPRGGVCPMLSARPRPRGGAGNRRLRSGSPGPEGQGPACSQRPELPTAEAQPRFPGQGAQGRHEDRAPERHLSAGQDRPPSRPAGHLPEGQQHPQHLHLPRGREGGCEAGPWGWGSPARRLGRARGPRPALRGPRGAGRSSAGALVGTVGRAWGLFPGPSVCPSCRAGAGALEQASKPGRAGPPVRVFLLRRVWAAPVLLRACEFCHVSFVCRDSRASSVAGYCGV